MFFFPRSMPTANAEAMTDPRAGIALGWARLGYRPDAAGRSVLWPSACSGPISAEGQKAWRLSRRARTSRSSSTASPALFSLSAGTSDTPGRERASERASERADIHAHIPACTASTARRTYTVSLSAAIRTRRSASTLTCVCVDMRVDMHLDVRVDCVRYTCLCTCLHTCPYACLCTDHLG